MRRPCTITLLVSLLLATLPATGAGQIPGDYPVIAVTAITDCDNAPTLWATSGYAPDEGTYDFFFYPMVYSGYGTFDAVRFGVTWPDDWTLLEVETCYGTFLEGNIVGPGSGVTLGLPPMEWSDDPAVRMRIHAGTAGVLGLTADPASGDFGYRTTEGTWHDYFGFSTPPGPGELTMYQVVIGETDVCSGPWPLYAPADFCSLWEAGPGYPGSVSAPGTINLPPDVTYVDTLSAYAYNCAYSTIPECGQPYPGPCLDYASTGVDWLSFDFRQATIGDFPVVMTVDTHGLEPGTYRTRVVADSFCDCGVTCFHVTLHVEPTPVEASTWGRIKASYRE